MQYRQLPNGPEHQDHVVSAEMLHSALDQHLGSPRLSFGRAEFRYRDSILPRGLSGFTLYGQPYSIDKQIVLRRIARSRNNGKWRVYIPQRFLNERLKVDALWR